MRTNILRLGVLGVYLGLVLVSLIIFVKPGASIFYYQKTIPSDWIASDEGYAYRIQLDVNHSILSARDVLLTENGQPLSIGQPDLLVAEGQGLFFLTDPAEGGFYLYFAPSNNSDPRTNGSVYTLFFPVFFFSRSMGLVYLAIFALLLGRFIRFGLKWSPNCWKDLASLPGFFSALDAFLRIEVAGLLYPLTNRQVLAHGRNHIWKHLLFWTILAAFAYIGMEWLFFVTKPSFMELFAIGEKLSLFLLTSLFIAVPALLFSLLLWGLDAWLPIFKRNGLPLLVASLIPAFLFTCLALLLVDNFTYTLFRFGVVTSNRLGTLIYTIFFLIAFIKIYQRLLLALGLRGTAAQPPKLSRWLAFALGGLLAVSLTLFLLRFDFASAASAQAQVTSPVSHSRPNIILLGSDGLDATHLSAYGYERDTTPALRELSERSLQAENVFTNASNSTGSVISIFTSKLPTQTRVLYPPNILQGADSYQHLPGILKREGYTTVELGVNHFVDAYQTNLRNGFDRVNDRSWGDAGWIQFMQGGGYDDVTYFAHLLWERISERLKHISFVQVMANPYVEVTNPTHDLVDEERINYLLDLIASSDKPFFAHAHMMGTHGNMFNPVIEQFSAGKIQDEIWMVDFYDDSILSFDAYLADVLEALDQSGKMDDTILIIYSDHGQQWITTTRIPLLIRFPHDQYAGRIQSNVQNLDIAPTILDYLGLPIPDWMQGHSLLRANPPTDRLIHATGTNASVENYTLIEEKLSPPFYQFTYFTIVQCNLWYQYDVPTAEWLTGEVEGHTVSCDPGALLSLEDIQSALADLLAHHGYDVSSLR
jgi:arylsulfatase A-like enzyme